MSNQKETLSEKENRLKKRKQVYKESYKKRRFY